MEIIVEETKQADVRVQNCLLLLILMDKSFNKVAFKATLTKVWNLEASISFGEVGNHRFLVEFQRRTDIERVMQGKPWTFDKHLIQTIDRSTPPIEVKFYQEPFWIQLHGLPLAAMT